MFATNVLSLLRLARPKPVTPAPKTESFRQLDRNASGFITRDELYLSARTEDELVALRAAFMDKHDANRDGRVTRKEFGPKAPLPPEAQAILADLEAGKTDDATRAKLAAYFGPAGMEESHALMEAIREAGLLDTFLDAAMRDEDGQPVAPELKEAARIMLETGRLDVYAETLATTSINHYDPATETERAEGFGSNTVYSPGDKGIYFNGLWSPDEMAKTMAHELFHAYNDAHGLDGGPGVTGAMNEGFGIAAIKYAFEPDKPFNMAEMIYGTKNFYRDFGVGGHDHDIALGDAANADPELREFLEAMAAQDRSQVAWDDPEQLEADYARYFEPIARDQDWDAWLADVEAATNRMLSEHRPAS